MNVVNCAACGAPIMWAQLGHPSPPDRFPLDSGETMLGPGRYMIVHPDHDPVVAVKMAPNYVGYGHLDHRATCPRR